MSIKADQKNKKEEQKALTDSAEPKKYCAKRQTYMGPIRTSSMVNRFDFQDDLNGQMKTKCASKKNLPHFHETSNMFSDKRFHILKLTERFSSGLLSRWLGPLEVASTVHKTLHPQSTNKGFYTSFPTGKKWASEVFWTSVFCRHYVSMKSGDLWAIL